MTQRRLFKSERTIKSQRNDYGKRNLESARLILSALDQHGGDEAFPAIWARLVIARIEGRTYEKE